MISIIIPSLRFLTRWDDSNAGCHVPMMAAVSFSGATDSSSYVDVDNDVTVNFHLRWRNNNVEFTENKSVVELPRSGSPDTCHLVMCDMTED